ncbi:MAG: fatty acyl-AMP ligase [Solirubrobacteraceae bacterium]
MTTRVGADQTFLDAVRRTLAAGGDRPAFTFLEEGEIDRAETLSFAALDRAARVTAGDLQAKGVRPGDRVMLMQEPGRHMVAGFLGAVYAGAIAVPCYPPSPFVGAKGDERLRLVVEDAGPTAALTVSTLAPALGSLKETYPELSWVLTDMAGGSPDAYTPVEAGLHDLAFLQYTSGSTSSPRGVRVTHGSLAANIEMMVEVYGLSKDTVVCSWLPPFHDMGLIATILLPLTIGCRTVQMAPWAFLRRPDRWLKAITHFGGTFTAAPNFAYELCVRRVSDLDGIDLESWTVAVNGAEPVKERTLAEFTRKFAECGLRPDALWPGYGLAEATLLASTCQRGPGSTLWIDPDQLSLGRLVPTEPETGRPLVSCGQSPPGTAVTVCDPATGDPVEDGVVGEIRVSGPHVCDGYWGDPTLSAEFFPDGVLRTGDLGALWQGSVYVTGRLKDLLIVRGRNHYPHDIEQTMEAVDPNLRPGCGVAVSVPTDVGELLVLIQEIANDDQGEPDRIVETIRRSVSEQHGVSADAVVLVQPSSVPKTTSGKLRRTAAAEAFRTGGLSVVHQWTATAVGNRR